MKKLIIILLLLLTVLTAENLSAQTKNKFALKNTWEVGGSFGFSSINFVTNGKTSNETITFIGLSSYGGYFIEDGFELGIIPSVGYLKYDDEDLTIFEFSIAPAYNFHTESSAYPYVQGAIGYNSLSYTYKSYFGDTKETNSGLVWKLEGGVKINIFGNSLLKLAAAYDQRTLNPDNYTGDRNGLNTFSFVAGFNVFFK
jgi:hypothetical protein